MDAEIAAKLPDIFIILEKYLPRYQAMMAHNDIMKLFIVI